MLDPNVPERRRMLIQGRVQGVGFRHFIWHHARALGLSGDVRNLPDGAVEVRASGDSGVLDQLLALARQGPTSANVTDIEIESEEGHPWPDGFRIRS